MHIFLSMSNKRDFLVFNVFNNAYIWFENNRLPLTHNILMFNQLCIIPSTNSTCSIAGLGVIPTFPIPRILPLPFVTESNRSLFFWAKRFEPTLIPCHVLGASTIKNLMFLDFEWLQALLQKKIMSCLLVPKSFWVLWC